MGRRMRRKVKVEGRLRGEGQIVGLTTRDLRVRWVGEVEVRAKVVDVIVRMRWMRVLV